MNNNDIVFEIIKKSKKHLTAYEILINFKNLRKYSQWLFTDL